jgi:bifunctional ADP-heptose synthase (sugar kinase/adenylyltransferase)
MNLASWARSVVLVGFTGGDADEAALLAASLKVERNRSSVWAAMDFRRLPSCGSWAAGSRCCGWIARIWARGWRPIMTGCWSKVLEELPQCHAVVLSDYAKGVLAPELCQAVIAAGA